MDSIERKKTNWVVIILVVLAILGFLAMVATVLGIAAISQVRDLAYQSTTKNNIKNLILGAHAYAILHEELPDDIRDAEGRPLLSWRVRLLPHIDEEPLYRAFHLDEPWDSPHNKLLLAKMPPTFTSLGLRASPPAHQTCLLAAKGAHCLTNAEGRTMTLAELGQQDGSSSTIYLIEVEAAASVPWTKPADLDVDLAQPRRHLDTKRPKGVIVGFADGMAVQIPSTYPDSEFRKLFTADGGRTGEEPLKEFGF